MTHIFKRVPSPVGLLTLVASGGALAAILWEAEAPGRVRLPTPAEQGDDPLLVEAARQLKGYFAGERRAFDLPLDARGTLFQQRVWAALLDIPFGETRSYAQMARAIGAPAASRAVGAANGRNPLSIVVPCHRVIGAGGALTGFAGGLAAKRYLLEHEAAAGVWSLDPPIARSVR